jgi:hypothetical protein
MSNVKEATTIRCSMVLQRPHGILQNQRTDATCIWTCRVSVRGQDVTSTAGKLLSRQTGNGAALITTVEANEFILSIFPSEKVCVEISGEQVTGSPKNAITELWGEQVAQTLYDRWVVVSKEIFTFVYWEGMEHVMKLFPEIFCIWVTTHFQGTN